MKMMNHVISCARLFLTLMSKILTPIVNGIFGWIYDSSSTKVSTVQNVLLLQSALSLARKIRVRELKAEDVMRAHIERAKAVNDQINAIVKDRYAEALKEAMDLDVLLDQNPDAEKYSEANQPFLGVPLSVKEAFSVKGMPNTGGLVSRKGVIANEDCPVVARMKQAGAIPFCITNVSELCMWYESANYLYGRTRNPYNTGRAVGGSSGGEGCNLAAGCAVIGIGSDIGGSIRMPAFFNGIFGHRSSRGLVPNEGQFPSATGEEEKLLSTGPMCRYVEDLRPSLQVMSDPNPQVDLSKKVDVSKLTIYNVVDDAGSLLLSEVDPQLKQTQCQVIKCLDSMGCTIKTVVIPKLKYSFDIWAAKMTSDDSSKSFSEYMGDGDPSFSGVKELMKWLIGQSSHTLPAIGLCLIEKMNFLFDRMNKTAVKGFEKLEKEMAEMLDENSVMIYPSHPKIAPYHNQPILYPLNWAYTGIFNALGLPVTQVPTGLSREGLPLGVQIIAGMNRDHLTISVAEALSEKGLCRWENP